MIVWDVDPTAFRIPVGSFHIAPRWYGVLFALGFFLGRLVAKQYFVNEKKDVALLDRLFTHILIGTIVGARLGHCLFYEPEVYLADPIRILKIWEGGLASHGAAVGNLIAIYLYFRKVKQFSLLW